MKRRLGFGLLGAVFLAVVIGAGRLEADRANRAQNNDFARLLATVGPHWDTTADAYRLSLTFDCLLYPVHADPYALELCFDARGRIVETADRRGSTPVFATLRFDPSEVTVGVDPARLVAALIRMKAAPKGTTSIPLGAFDRGPQLVPREMAATSAHS